MRLILASRAIHVLPAKDCLHYESGRAPLWSILLGRIVTERPPSRKQPINEETGWWGRKGEGARDDDVKRLRQRSLRAEQDTSWEATSWNPNRKRGGQNPPLCRAEAATVPLKSMDIDQNFNYMLKSPFSRVRNVNFGHGFMTLNPFWPLQVPF